MCERNLLSLFWISCHLLSYFLFELLLVRLGGHYITLRGLWTALYVKSYSSNNNNGLESLIHFTIFIIFKYSLFVHIKKFNPWYLWDIFLLVLVIEFVLFFKLKCSIDCNRNYLCKKKTQSSWLKFSFILIWFTHLIFSVN